MRAEQRAQRLEEEETKRKEQRKQENASKDIDQAKANVTEKPK